MLLLSSIDISTFEGPNKRNVGPLNQPKNGNPQNWTRLAAEPLQKASFVLVERSIWNTTNAID